MPVGGETVWQITKYNTNEQVKHWEISMLDIPSLKIYSHDDQLIQCGFSYAKKDPRGWPAHHPKQMQES
jgi:hypothetical protein